MIPEHLDAHFIWPFLSRLRVSEELILWDMEIANVTSFFTQPFFWGQKVRPQAIGIQQGALAKEPVPLRYLRCALDRGINNHLYGDTTWYNRTTPMIAKFVYSLLVYN